MSWLSEAIHHADAPTISAVAASVAAVVAGGVAAIQFSLGRRQTTAALTSAQAALMNAQNAGKHKIAEFRQDWIYKVIDEITEHHSILVTRPEDLPRRLQASRIKLEILLNPDEEDTVSLLSAIDAIDAATDDEERVIQTKRMLAIAHQLLKREWVRIKDELGSASATAPPSVRD